MPPPGSDVPALSAVEKLTFARWVDLGCPINEGQGTENEAFGWFVDDLRPVLTVSSPRPNLNTTPLAVIRFGLADIYSGLDLSTLSITSTLAINGRAAGAQLSDLAQVVGDGIYEIGLTNPISDTVDALLYVAVADKQGNITRAAVEFSVRSDGVPVPTLTPSPTPNSLRKKVYLPIVEN